MKVLLLGELVNASKHRVDGWVTTAPVSPSFDNALFVTVYPDLVMYWFSCCDRVYEEFETYRFGPANVSLLSTALPPVDSQRPSSP